MRRLVSTQLKGKFILISLDSKSENELFSCERDKERCF